jgi:cytosine/adenosine deaminase-related metal-dependent hydrolase
MIFGSVLLAWFSGDDLTVSVVPPSPNRQLRPRPQGATREIDASRMYVLPGFVDTHVHTGGFPKAPQAEDPTLVIYDAGRDLMKAMTLEWNDEYTLSSLWDYYQPSRAAHGSYWFDWTSEDEYHWRKF